jgi:hypothetical protein
MSRRSAVRVGVVSVLVVAVGGGGLVWWTRPWVVEAGSTVVLIEGRELGPRGESLVGVGVTGVLGLVGGRCVGLVRTLGALDGSVIVWPPDTQVSGSGTSVAITSRGVTRPPGDEINAGTRDGLRFPDFVERLPAECEGSELMDLQLGG